ncbi:MAG TPA: type IV toxin-antitoxin system AbiEi family antitoxin domain-containing protein, partial [Egibacteraceae bacterium]|nr:type IV toxin-antitoxin system AbiEi family antitoxin domain-containing protein [Egibacteraceae bacterium]
MFTLPAEVSSLFACQWGVASRRQLVALAKTAKAVDGWVRHGLLIRVHRGVYRLRGVPVTPHSQIMAAVLRGGDDAVAGPFASSALHGLDGFTLGGTLDIVVAAQRQLSNLSFAAHALDLEPADRCVVDDIPALKASSSLILLGNALGEEKWRVAWDDARRRKLVTLDRMGRRVAAHPDWPGADTVGNYLAGGVLLPDGEGERRLQGLLVGFHPQPEWGVEDLVPGRRLDCAWREVLLALEYDGRDHHVLPTDRDNDGIRDLECEVHGVKILRITAGMLRRDAPGVKRMIELVYARRRL